MPIELIAVVLGTVLSRLLFLKEKYNVRTIGHIPTGFPGTIQYIFPKLQRHIDKRTFSISPTRVRVAAHGISARGGRRQFYHCNGLIHDIRVDGVDFRHQTKL